MAAYGLEVYDTNGRKVLTIGDSLGRIVGQFTVPALSKGQTRTDSFTASAEATKYGKIFVWMNPHDYWHESSATTPYAASRTIITINGRNIQVVSYAEHGRGSFPLYYGVV